MTREQINGYTVRISQSSRTELVAITCEIITDYVKDAVEALSKDDKKGFTFFLKKAMSFVDDLSSSLDMQYSISANLLSLYMYVKRIFIHACAVYTDEKLDAAVRIITQIKAAFETIAQQDISKEPVMEGGEQIYTGLTYGKDSRLDEYIVGNNYNN